MGCAQSRIDNEESVARCKDRKTLMKNAVLARNAFAAAHSGYAISLKNTGAALSDYGHGKVEVSHQYRHQINHLDSTPRPHPPPPIMDNLPPLPPLPNFSPSPVAPVKRAVSMPAMPVKIRKAFDASLAIKEEEEDEYHKGNEVGDDNNNNNSEHLRRDSRGPPRIPENNNVGDHPPPMPQAKNMAWDYFFMVDDNNMLGPSLDLDKNNIGADNTNVEALPNNVNGVGSSGHGGVDIEVEPKTLERPEEKVVMAVEVHDKWKQQVQIEHSKTALADLRRVVRLFPV